MNKISLEQLEKEDLCFEAIHEEKLYDNSTLDEFFEEYTSIFGKNIKNNNYLLEKFKHIKVYKKDYFRIGKYRIEEYIQDYFDDNYGTSDEYTVIFSETAENLLKEFLKTVEHDNQVYTINEFVGYLDLNEELQAYINDNYVEEEVE